MDKIFISQLRLEAIIGVYPEERLTPQPIVLDIELMGDTHAAAMGDDIKKTIDYAVLIQQLQAWMHEESFHLIEALAHYLAEKILQNYRIEMICLTVHKFPAGLPVANVGVRIVRQKLLRASH